MITPWFLILLTLSAAPKKEPGTPFDNTSSGNHKPKIQDVSFSPSKIVAVSKPIVITAKATDLDFDLLEFKWELEGEGEADYKPSAQGNKMTFIGKTPGRYQVTLTVCDVPKHGKPLCSDLKFNLDVVASAASPKK